MWTLSPSRKPYAIGAVSGRVGGPLQVWMVGLLPSYPAAHSHGAAISLPLPRPAPTIKGSQHPVGATGEGNHSPTPALPYVTGCPPHSRRLRPGQKSLEGLLLPQQNPGSRTSPTLASALCHGQGQPLFSKLLALGWERSRCGGGCSAISPSTTRWQHALLPS